MDISKKILVYFSLTTIVVLGIALMFIFTLFSDYREEEFRQRQKDKIVSTIKFLVEIKHADQIVLESIDMLTINDLYDEKLILFDKNKNLIYSSIDDTPLLFSKSILSSLSTSNPVNHIKDGLYDVVGIYYNTGGNIYYGISKAYDTFGYTKLQYLKFILLTTFFGITVIVIMVSYFLSQKITQPLLALTKKINQYDFDADFDPIVVEQSKNEIAALSVQFNKLMKRVHDVYAFQKHAIHHISHELKTPISILVSNFERIELETDIKLLKEMISQQKKDTKSLGGIINSLLEISKAEAGNALNLAETRIDELIFDIAEDLNIVNNDFHFMIDYLNPEDENYLIVNANNTLLKAALQNLMVNCINYSRDKTARINIAKGDGKLKISFENNGPIIIEQEKQFLFQHFFRGENSVGHSGFGLGLVFVYKILRLHGGTVSYSSICDDLNVFTIVLPLRESSEMVY